MPKKICVDFDTVLDSGKFDLRGDGSLSNAPIDGSMEWLSSLKDYKVLIFGKASHTFGGRARMRIWLFETMLDACLQGCKPGISSWHNRIVKSVNTQVQFDVHIYKSVKKWIKGLDFPSRFPCCLYVSHNVAPFFGEFPRSGELEDAKG